MKLAFMSFSMMREAFLGKMDADTLCAVAAENGLHILDLQEAEIALYLFFAENNNSGMILSFSPCPYFP